MAALIVATVSQKGGVGKSTLQLAFLPQYSRRSAGT